MLHRPRPTEPFPVSNDALTAFVSQAQSPREIDFYNLPLSIDQWRAIVFNCNENVKLCFYHHRLWQTGVAADVLIDSLNRNHCPTKVAISCPQNMPQATFNALVAALEANTSLMELEVGLANSDVRRLGTDDRPSLLFGAISRNRALKKLGLGINSMADHEWECFWSAVASHPTIKSLIVSGSFDANAESTTQQRPETMLRSVLSNTVLCELECDYQRLFPDGQANEEQIRPILELIRFRLVVQAIKQEPNAERRERLFAETLLGDQVRESSSACYLLLNENPDLLVQLSESLVLVRHAIA